MWRFGATILHLLSSVLFLRLLLNHRAKDPRNTVLPIRSSVAAERIAKKDLKLRIEESERERERERRRFDIGFVFGGGKKFLKFISLF